MAWDQDQQNYYEKLARTTHHSKFLGLYRITVKIDRDNSLLGKVAAGGKFKGNN